MAADHAYSSSSMKAIVRTETTTTNALASTSKRRRFVSPLSQSYDSASFRRRCRRIGVAATTTDDKRDAHNDNDDEDDEETIDDRLTTSCFADLKMQTLAECGPNVCEELTNLAWLHETNLLSDLQTKTKHKFDGSTTTIDSRRVVTTTTTAAGPPPSSSGKSSSPIQSVAMSTPTNAFSSSPVRSGGAAAAIANATTGKPPYSFACLIFMAIEDAPTKRLAVKDIYQWIQDNFAYFKTAPAGWKNSVRHNLSLNKSFKRTDKQRGQVGKGSLWTVDLESRAALVQALRKTHHQPFEQYIRSTGTKRSSRSSESSDGSSVDGNGSKRFRSELSPEETAAAQIMCSFGGTPTSFSKSTTRNATSIVTPKPKHVVHATRSSSAAPRLRGKRTLKSAQSTAFERSSSSSSSSSPTTTSENKAERNLFSGLQTVATVASLARDIEEKLSRHTSARSSPIMTRRSKAANQNAASRLLEEAVAREFAGKDDDDDDDDDNDAEVAAAALNDSGFGDGRQSGSNSSPESAAATAEIFLQADKILTMKGDLACETSAAS